MIIIFKILRKILEKVIGMSWTSVLVIFFSHALTSYFLLVLLNETGLSDRVITFVYFYFVSASTVGYGDLSPGTDWGRIAVAMFVLPGANMVFMLIITKIITATNKIMRVTMNGLGNFEGRSGHFVIVGYQPRKTERLMLETKGMHGSEDIVLVSKAGRGLHGVDATPIKVTELSSIQGLKRAGVATASKVVVIAEDDAETLAAALAISVLNPKGHVVAYFESREQAGLLKRHCDKFEVVVSTSIEQVSRAMTDPGASKIFEDLSCASKSATLLSIEIPENCEIDLELARECLSYKGANLVCFRESGDQENNYNIFKSHTLKAGAILFYIGSERLPENFQKNFYIDTGRKQE